MACQKRIQAVAIEGARLWPSSQPLDRRQPTNELGLQYTSVMATHPEQERVPTAGQ